MYALLNMHNIHKYTCLLCSVLYLLFKNKFTRNNLLYFIVFIVYSIPCKFTQMVLSRMNDSHSLCVLCIETLIKYFL